MNVTRIFEAPKLRIACLTAAMALALVTFGACEGAERADDPEEVAVAERSEADPLDASMAIDDVTLGGELSADGSIDTGNTDDEFAPGDPIYIAMEVGDAIAGAEVTVRWFDPDDLEIATETKAVEIDQHYMNFEAPSTVNWEFGTYRGEVWYADQMINEFEYQIVDEVSADPLEAVVEGDVD